MDMLPLGRGRHRFTRSIKRFFRIKRAVINPEFRIQFRKISIVIPLLIILSSCSTAEKVSEKFIGTTKYPVLLVHGFNEWTTIPYPNSLVDLTRFLKKRGHNVYYAKTDAFAKIEDNAAQILYSIQKVLEENPSIDKVNIIAYSKGGLDARYAVTFMGAGPHTASLTTLATPHRGSTAIDFFSTWWLTSNRVSVFLLHSLGRLAGDKSLAYSDCLQQMTRDKMRIFNRLCTDYPGVKYYSLSSLVSRKYLHIIYGSTRDLIYTVEGSNDGIVSEKSAAWGEYLGTINDFCECSTDISHTDIVGLNIPHNHRFDHEYFFLDLIEFLAMEGF